MVHFLFLEVNKVSVKADQIQERLQGSLKFSKYSQQEVKDMYGEVINTLIEYKPKFENSIQEKIL